LPITAYTWMAVNTAELR